MSYKIHIQNSSTLKNIPQKNQFKLWISTALTSRTDNAEITVRIVDETESATLNENYRHKKGATNIISFPYKSNHHSHTALMGDMVICAPIVVNEAKQQNKSITGHWAHLTIHGTLHLLGYDHVIDEQAIRMETLEIKLLKSLGFSNPYQEQDDE